MYSLLFYLTSQPPTYLRSPLNADYEDKGPYSAYLHVHLYFCKTSCLVYFSDLSTFSCCIILFLNIRSCEQISYPSFLKWNTENSVQSIQNSYSRYLFQRSFVITNIQILVRNNTNMYLLLN